MLWATVRSIELAAQPLSTPHWCLRVTVLKLSDLTAFATLRFFCERSHSFLLVSCSFCERSHSFRLVSCTSPYPVVVYGLLSCFSFKAHIGCFLSCINQVGEGLFVVVTVRSRDLLYSFSIHHKVSRRNCS